jgi:hypothetical protein
MVLVSVCWWPLNVKGAMEAVVEPARPISEVFLVLPFHVAISGGIFPLLEGPGDSRIID